jgi:uncharacterized Zn-finger protein
LKIHQRQHSGERPFHCHICKASFIVKSSLKKHLQIHSEVHP